MSSRIEDQKRETQLAATFLEGDHLTRHAGNVLAALTRDFAGTAAAGKYDTALLRLADSIPDWWMALSGRKGYLTRSLRDKALAETLARTLNSPTQPPPLDRGQIEALLHDAARLDPKLDGFPVAALAAYIQQRLTDALASGLTAMDEESTRAFREVLLDFHSQTLGLLQEIRETGLDTNKTVHENTGTLGRIEERLLTDDALARLRAYRENLVSAFRSYDELGIDNFRHGEDRAPDIWDIFVPPACTEAPLSPEAMEEAQKAQPPSSPTRDLLPLLGGETRRHVLLGDPGMGKSTLIQRLVAGLAAGRATPGAPALRDCLPVPFILRDLVPLLPADPTLWTWDALCRALREDYKRNDQTHLLFSPWENLPHECRREVFENPHAFFLIDGLDEIGDPAKRTAIRDAIWEGFDAHLDARWLVASRVVGYEMAAVHHQVEVSGNPEDTETSREEDAELATMGGFRLLVPYDALLRASAISKNDREVKFMCDEHSENGIRRIVFPLADLIYLAPFDDARQEGS